MSINSSNKTSWLGMKLRSYNARVLDAAARNIYKAAAKTGASVSGPVPLPRENSRCLLNNAPHGDKRSMTALHMRKYKRFIKITGMSSEELASLKLDLPPGLDLEIKEGRKEIDAIPSAKEETKEAKSKIKTK